MRKQARQKQLPFSKGWGGRRKGSGRKLKNPRPSVPHRTRVELGKPAPLHVNVRLKDGLPSLRRGPEHQTLRSVLSRCRVRKSFRVVHYALQPRALHRRGRAARGRRARDGRAADEFGASVEQAVEAQRQSVRWAVPRPRAPLADGDAQRACVRARERAAARRVAACGKARSLLFRAVLHGLVELPRHSCSARMACRGEHLALAQRLDARRTFETCLCLIPGRAA